MPSTDTAPRALPLRMVLEKRQPKDLNAVLYGPQQPGRTPDGVGWRPTCCGLPMALRHDGWHCAATPACGALQDFRPAQEA